MITGEQAVFERKTNKHGKTVGKSVLNGYRFEFSNALNGMAATDTAYYQIDNIISKSGHKNKNRVPILQPITGFSVSYSADIVTISFTAPEKFKTGGLVTVESGVTGSKYDELTGTTTFTISRGGRGITPM
jgi:hypothetical protein